MTEKLTANKILEYGEKLPFNWYKYNNEYYNVIGDNIRYVTDDLIVDKEKGYYIAPLRTSQMINITLIFIKGVESIKYHMYYKDVEFIYDKYYIVNLPDINTKELHYLTDEEYDTVLISDDIIYTGQLDKFFTLSHTTYYVVLVQNGTVIETPITVPENNIHSKETIALLNNLQN